MNLTERTEVLFRINPDFVPSGMNKGSAAASRSGSPFGMDLKGGEVMKALEMIKEMKRIRFRDFISISVPVFRILLITGKLLAA